MPSSVLVKFSISAVPKRPIWIRIREHVQNIIKSYPKHSISKHYATHHNKDPPPLSFIGENPLAIVSLSGYMRILFSLRGIILNSI